MKVLVSYSQESGLKILKSYSDKEENRAIEDLELLMAADVSGPVYELRESLL